MLNQQIQGGVAVSSVQRAIPEENSVRMHCRAYIERDQLLYRIVFEQGRGFRISAFSYGTGVKVGFNGAGIPMISEYSYRDPDNPDNSVNQYLWSGRAFIFARKVKLPK